MAGLDRWESPVRELPFLHEITGVEFRQPGGGNAVQSKRKPTYDERDRLRYLELNYAIQLASTPGGLALVSAINPYALRTCGDILADDLPRELDAARPVIECITRKDWKLGAASLSTQVDFSDPLVALLDKLVMQKKLKLDFRDNDTVAIYHVSPSLAGPAATQGRPAARSLSSDEKARAFGPLPIFPGGRMFQGWTNWAPD